MLRPQPAATTTIARREPAVKTKKKDRWGGPSSASNMLSDVTRRKVECILARVSQKSNREPVFDV